MLYPGSPIVYIRLSAVVKDAQTHKIPHGVRHSWKGNLGNVRAVKFGSRLEKALNICMKRESEEYWTDKVMLLMEAGTRLLQWFCAFSKLVSVKRCCEKLIVRFRPDRLSATISVNKYWSIKPQFSVSIKTFRNTFQASEVLRSNRNTWNITHKADDVSLIYHIYLLKKR